MSNNAGNKTRNGENRTGQGGRNAGNVLTTHDNAPAGKAQDIKIYSFGRRVGTVRGGVLYKSIHGSQHFLRKPAGIAFDVDTLEQAKAAGATMVQVTDLETGTLYRAALSHILEVGLRFNRGYGPQVVLTFSGWTKSKRGRLEQPSLFGGAL